MDNGNGISPICIGLDIGFGNLKVAASKVGSTHVDEIVLPVGAAPASTLNRDHHGRPIVGDGVVVMLEGEEWGVGLRPLDADHFERKINENYPLSREYLGLFYCALAKLKANHVSMLVTGLPVSQYFGSGMAEAVVRRLQGNHYVNADVRNVTVDKVIVFPQPVGGFSHQQQLNPKIGKDRDKLLLVIDVGYFSVDWVLLRGATVQKSGSGSSTHATSRILELASQQISEAAGGIKTSSARIESAFREGREAIEIGRNAIQVNHYITAAAKPIAQRVLTEVSNSLRSINESVDQVLLLGGGGGLFAQAAGSEFPKADVILGNDPVMSNAAGFLRLGRQAAAAKSQPQSASGSR